MERVIRSTCFVLLVILISCSIVSAQSSEPKYEIGFQVPYIIQSASIRDNLEGIAGFGARFTYNINNSLSVETEANFFPRNRTSGYNSVQNQIGGKIGKRFGNLGVYGKLRPGFINTQHRRTFFTFPVFITPAETVVTSETVFSLDSGLVIQYYSHRHIHYRFDIGHTYINTGKLEQNTPIPFHRNNLHWSVGIGFHF